MKPIITIFLTIWIVGFSYRAVSQSDSLYFGVLEGITVKPKANPAHRIIDAAHARRDSNSAFHCTAFQYITYHKMTILPTKVSDSLKKLENQYLFLSESVSEVYFKQPHFKYEKMIASKTSGLDNPLFNMIFCRLQFQNFYEGDFLEILQVKYLSPIAKGSTKQYRFELCDTLLSGTDTTFVIKFQPKPKSNFNGLKGVLYIHEGDFAISKVEAEPADTSNFLQIPIVQEYKKMENGTWFPTTLTATFKLPQIADKRDTLEACGISRITIKDIVIDPQLRTRDFGIFEVEEAVVSSSSSASILHKYRDDTLTIKELRTYSLIDSISRKLKLNRQIEKLPELLNGYIPIKFINLEIASLINHTEQEGWRLGLGLYTNRKLLRFGTFGGYFAYGTLDKTWKWGVSTAWELYRKRQLTLKIKFYDDIVESGHRPQLGRDGIALLNGEYSRLWVVSRFNKSRALWSELSMRADKNFTVNIAAAYSRNQTLYPYAYLPAGNADDKYFAFTQAFVRAGVRFAYHETMFQTRDISLYQDSKYPTVQFYYERGIKGVFGSGYNYNNLHLRVYHRQRYKRLGYSEIALYGGFIDRTLPYPLLFVAPGDYSELGYYGKELFQTMRPSEFVSDRYVSLFFRHNFGKMRDGWFSPRIVLCQHIGFGWLRQSQVHGGFVAESTPKGFIESGLMIDNILSIKDILAVGIGLFYRYGAYQLPLLKDNFSFKLSLTIPMYE